MRKVVLIAAGCLAAYAGGAHAQDPAATSSGGQLEEVVVTAQKRSEDLQRVPIVVSVVGADDLAASAVTDSKDLSAIVPGLTFGMGIGNNVSYLRGVGQGGGQLGIESPLATYVDGVYIVSPAATLFSLGNVEQIEVLKGPQGTLFGRNATAGVIHVRTKRPSHERSLDVEAGYGAYRSATGRLYATGGLTDTLATNLAIAATNRADGYVRNAYLGRDVYQERSFAAQNKWLWTPSDRLEVAFSASYSQNYGFQGTTSGVYPGALGSDRSTRYIDEYVVVGAEAAPLRTKNVLTSLRVDYDLGWARLMSLTGYNDFHARTVYNQNGLPPNGVSASVVSFTLGEDRTFTQEVQLQAPADADLQWIIGAFYMRDDVDVQLSALGYTATARPVLFHVDSQQETESVAMFAQATKTIAPDTRLTFGARYTQDDANLTGRRYVGGVANGFVYTPGTLTGTAASIAAAQNPPSKPAVSSSKPTFRVALDHNFTPDILAYVSYNRGYKSGLLDVVLASPATAPETLDAYEAGVKSMLFNSRLRLNASVFLYNYKNMQLRAVGPTPPAQLTYNAGAARVEGLDVDFEALVAEGLTISGGAEYLWKAQYTSFPRGIQSYPNPWPFGFTAAGAPVVPAGCIGPVTSASALPGGNGAFSCDLSGNRLVRSPKWTANLAVQYEVDMAAGGSLRLTASDGYNSGYFFADDNRTRQSAYHNVRASAKWTSPSRTWDVTLWGSNLLDEKIYTSVLQATTDAYFPGEPRMYGVTVGAHF
jgi:iron complex outermembrane receptor protein